MTPGPTHPPDADEPIDFRALYYAIYEERYWVAAVAVVTVVAACVYLLVTPKVYAAQTIVQVEQRSHKILNIQDIANEDLNATELLKTIEQNLANEALLELLRFVVVGMRCGSDRLQRDETSDERIFGKVNDSHGSLAELANHLIPAELHLLPVSVRISDRRDRRPEG